MIKICREVYQTKCFFKINPFYGNYASWGGTRAAINQNGFLEIMTTLKEDGADGFALWVDHRHLDPYID